MKPTFSQRIEKGIRKHSVLITIFLVLSAIPVFCLCPDKHDLILKVIGGIIAALFAWLWKDREQIRMVKEIFETFNKGYDENFNDTLNLLSRGKTPKNKEGKALDKEEVTNLIIDYFNMCSGEYLWYSKGLVPEDIWVAWRSGIVSNIKRIKEVEDVWEMEFEKKSEQRDSFYGLYGELKMALKPKEQ